MFGKLKLRKRRLQLRQSLSADPLQPPWDDWLTAADTLAHLHATCDHAGWLVHCALWNAATQDALCDCALALAAHALDCGPAGVFPLASLDGIADRDWPELAEAMVTLETRFEPVQLITDCIPTQLNYTLVALGDARMAAGREPDLDPAAHPYRDGTWPLADRADEVLAAAGYSLVMYCLFHRHEGLREALAFACAGAAACFTAAMPDRQSALVDLTRLTLSLA